MYKIIGCKKKYKHFDLTDFGFGDWTKNDVVFGLKRKKALKDLIDALRLKHRFCIFYFNSICKTYVIRIIFEI